jgi:hypothetical protein
MRLSIMRSVNGVLLLDAGYRARQVRSRECCKKHARTLPP